MLKKTNEGTTRKQLEAYHAKRQKRGLQRHHSEESLGPSASDCSALAIYEPKESASDFKDKIQKFREGALDDTAFTADNLHKIAGRFAHARGKSSKLNEAYQKVSVSSAGKVDRKAARFCMLQWLKRPEDCEAVVSSFNCLQGSDGLVKETPWLSQKQLVDMFGEEEAQEMIEGHLVLSRPNPCNPQRRQYQVCLEKGVIEAKKVKSITGNTEYKASGEDALALENSFDAYKITSSMLETAALDLGLDLKSAMKDEGFLALVHESCEGRKSRKDSSGSTLALEDADGTEADASQGTFNYATVKSEVLKQQAAEEEKAKQLKNQKREENKAKHLAREAKLGMQALASCEKTYNDTTKEDCLPMMKEVLQKGFKAVHSATILKPRITKEKFSGAFVKEFQQTLYTLQQSHEAMLNTQGLFQAEKCSIKFALKAIANLATITLKMRQLIDATSGK